MKRAAFLFFALALMVTVFACNGRQAPSGTTNNSINMNGGNSTLGTGGSPGWINGYTYGGPIAVNSSGSVNAGFTVPTYTSYYGPAATTKELQSGKTVVQLNQNLVPGGLFMSSTDNTEQLYIGNGDGDANTPALIPGDTNAVAVTGLIVDSGATLTLPANNGSSSVTVFADDVTINGLVNTTAAPGSTFAIKAGTSNNPVSATGNIIITGEVDGINAGAAGDSIYLGGGIVINHGTINANGGVNASGAGQDGGIVDLEGSSYTVNTGTIEANGGDGTTSGGGSGDQEIVLESDYGNVYNSGYLLAKGGSGSNGSGGLGGQVYLEGCDQTNSNGLQGDILASNLIDVSGGNGSNGNGGYGGYVEFDTYAQGNVKVSAQINGNGGGATGSFSGAEPGQVGFYSDGEDEVNPPAYVGAVQVGNQINLNGGNGDGDALNNNNLSILSGFSGSGIWFDTEDNTEYNGGYYPGGVYSPGDYGPSAPVILYTNGSISMNGGNGYTGGGNASGGGVYLHTYSPVDAATGTALLPAGSITFQANVSNQGGAVTDGNANSYTGGNGGLADIEAAAYCNANLNVSNNYNDSGAIVNVTGSMDLNAGPGGIGGPASTGTVYPFQLGGTGAQESVFIAGQTVFNTGSISANGGNGQAAGGNGGDVYLDSYLLNTYNTGPAPSVAGGSGSPAGTAGTVTIH